METSGEELAYLGQQLTRAEWLRHIAVRSCLSRFGVIAYYSMVLCFAGTATMLVLVILGLVHLSWQPKPGKKR